MTDTPITYGGLTAEEWQAGRLALVGVCNGYALLDALDHIDRLKAELRTLDSNYMTAQANWELTLDRADKAEAGQAHANALNAALIADMAEMLSRAKAERDRLREALLEIRDHWANQYDHPKKAGEEKP